MTKINNKKFYWIFQSFFEEIIILIKGANRQYLFRGLKIRGATKLCMSRSGRNYPLPPFQVPFEDEKSQKSFNFKPLILNKKAILISNWNFFEIFHLQKNSKRFNRKGKTKSFNWTQNFELCKKLTTAYKKLCPHTCLA